MRQEKELKVALLKRYLWCGLESAEHFFLYVSLGSNEVSFDEFAFWFAI